MPVRRKDERLLGKLILSCALVAVSAAYGTWQKTAPRPGRPAVASLSTLPVLPAPLVAANPAPQAAEPPANSAAPAGNAAPVPATALAKPAPAAVTAKDAVMAKVEPPDDSAANTPPAPAVSPVVSQAPPGAAIYAEAGSHIEDGQYTSSPRDFQWGTVQIQAQIKNGVFTDIRFLQIPDHRPQSAELSDLSKPILVAETIHDQKAGVDIVSSATYTSFAYQDALTDVIVRATRR